MNTPNDGKPSSIDSAKKERLSLRRETLRTLNVRTGVQTGMKVGSCATNTCANNSEEYSCRIMITSMQGTVG